MTLPLTVRSTGPEGNERRGQTRDVSFRGLYFLIEADYAPGSPNIRCFAEIVRVEPHNGKRGVAARIDRYEFLPTASVS